MGVSNMKMQKRNFTTTEMTVEDINAIWRTMDIVNTLASHITEKADLISLITGEVVQISELPRVLGVLSALRDNEIWEVKFKD